MSDAKMPDGAPSRERPGESESTGSGGILLTAAQLHALFDILTHHQTYAEIVRFKLPSTVAHYGYPFVTETAAGNLSQSSASSVPLLASLFRPVVLPTPGVRDLPPEFWSVRFQGIVASLGAAELSESYDKGALGTRKTLATAASAIHESVSRGRLGGVPRGETRDLHGTYDGTEAGEVVRAWDDAVHEIVYGSLIEDLFDCAADKESLEEHSPAIRLAVDYIIIHMATFMHHILVLSPEGPYLLKLAENVHRMIPYALVKQTLRIGNAATMLHGMLKIFLAKVSVGAMSNWLGITQNADDGMNLLQRIISLVLSWDSSEFRKSAERIEKSKDGPSKEHLAALKEFINRSRDEHEAMRNDSMARKVSIVAAILEEKDPGLLSSLSENQHTKCLEFYSALLSIRDREEITKALCAQSPDIFSQAIRDLAASFEPMIRTIHEGIDLREHVSAAESFLNDLISASKAEKNATPYGLWKKAETKTASAPSVEDYVNLLRRNRQLLYNWLHQIASKCPDISDDFRAWVKKIMVVFQANVTVPLPPTSCEPSSDAGNGEARREDSERRAGAAGALSGDLQKLFAALSQEDQEEVLVALDAHARYFSSLEDLSITRMQHVLDNLAAAESSGGEDAPDKTASMSGPGIFLSRWQALLNETAITPAPPGGSLRLGKDVKGSTSLGKTGAVLSKDIWDAAAIADLEEEGVPQPPEIQVVVDTLGPQFEELLAQIAQNTT